MMTRRLNDFVPLLITIAGYVVLNTWMFDGVMGGPDAESYLSFATEAQQGSYWTDPDAFLGTYFPVGYPILLSTLGINQEQQILGFVLHMFLGAIVLTSTWGLASTLSSRSRTTVTLVIAVSPFMTWMTQNLGYEIACAAVLTSAAFFAIRLRAQQPCALLPTLALSAAVGFFLGWALLMQAAMVAPVAVILFFLLIRRPLSGVAATLGAVILPLIWAARNFFVLERFSPFSTNGPLVFWHGNNPVTIAGAAQSELIPPPDGSRTLTQAAVDFLLSQPEAATSLYGRKIARLLEPNFVYIANVPQQVQTFFHILSALFSLSLLILVLAYVFRLLWVPESTPTQLKLSVGIVVGLFLIYIPFQSEPRYLTPIGPFAVVIAAACISKLKRRFTTGAKRVDSFGP